MVHVHDQQHVTDEDRRELLKALGVAGAVAAGGVTFEELRTEATAGATDDLAPIGEKINADLAGSVDASLVAGQQAEIASRTQALAGVQEKGFPIEGPREEFIGIAEAARPIYEHLVEIDFFESTTRNLPEMTQRFLESAVQTFAASEALAAPFEELGLTGTAGVDMLAEVIANAEKLRTYHWVATDEIPREQVEMGEYIPPMTMGAAGGSLLWLEDLDDHLWKKRVLLTDKILQEAVWHGESLAGGIYLMSEGARVLGAEERLTNEELGSLLTIGFAVQAIAQGLLPADVYWIKEEERAERRTDLAVHPR